MADDIPAMSHALSNRANRTTRPLAAVTAHHHFRALEDLRLQTMKKRDWAAGTVFTVGHSTRSLGELIELLGAYGVECVGDVRAVPRSRRNPQFNAEALGPALALAGIGYEPMKGLGGLRHPRKDSPNGGWTNESFRGFADYMQTDAFRGAVDQLIEASRARRVAMMCAEAVPWRCHRSLVADALLARGVPAIEILSQASWRIHELTPFARVEGTSITYPPAPR
jgi:uncharacterized protein (DUF488 family)